MINLNEMKRDYIGREPRDYIVESVTVPEGLEEKVLAAMTQKRKEIEEIQKEKQEKKAAHKSVALRAAVIAAVITLMILIIPSSRQVVVSAAESAWNGIIEWIDGWINPLYNPISYTTDNPYPDEARNGNAEVTTVSIESNKAKFPKYSYDKDFKYDELWECEIANFKVPIQVKSDEFLIDFYDMQIINKETAGAQEDISFTCTIRRIPSYDISEKEWDEIYKGEKGTFHFPDYFSYDISSSSCVEIAFLKKDKPCLKMKYNLTYDNFINYPDGFGTHSITCGSFNPTRCWYDKKYYDILDYDSENMEWQLGKALAIIKPDSIEICSADIIFDEISDLIKTDDKKLIKKLVKKGYDYTDDSEGYFKPQFFAFKKSSNIIKGYNPKYYDIEAEAEKNQKLIDEFNSRVK